MGGAKIDGFCGKGNGHRDNNSSTGRHNLPRLIRKIHGNGGEKDVLRESRKRCFAFSQGKILPSVIIYLSCTDARAFHRLEFIDTRRFERLRFGNISVNAANEHGYVKL